MEPAPPEVDLSLDRWDRPPQWADYCRRCRLPGEACECPLVSFEQDDDDAEPEEEGDDGPGSWAPVDLGPYLRGEITRPTPTLGVARSDGVRLLYPGKEHVVVGEMEAGKSWFALACAAAEMANGRTVLYVHYEEPDPSGTVERLLALGCHETELLKLFRFVAPDRQVSADALACLLDPVPSLVIHDGVNEAMALHGWDAGNIDGASHYRRYLVKPCLRAGAAVLSSDHVVKDVEKRGRNAIGSVHKGNRVDGAQITLEAAEPFGRGARGRSHVYVTKDRPGHLRQHGEPTRVVNKTYMGELVVDDTQMYGPELYLNFWAPNPKPVADADAGPDGDPDEAAVLAAIEAITAKGLDANLRLVRSATGLRAQATDGALDRLVLAGSVVETTGKRNARIFSLTVSQDQSSEVSS